MAAVDPTRWRRRVFAPRSLTTWSKCTTCPPGSTTTGAVSSDRPGSAPRGIPESCRCTGGIFFNTSRPRRFVRATCTSATTPVHQSATARPPTCSSPRPRPAASASSGFPYEARRACSGLRRDCGYDWSSQGGVLSEADPHGWNLVVMKPGVCNREEVQLPVLFYRDAARTNAPVGDRTSVARSCGKRRRPITTTDKTVSARSRDA